MDRKLWSFFVIFQIETKEITFYSFPKLLTDNQRKRQWETCETGTFLHS